MSTIFLDRDGVINENRPDYVKSWDEFRFLPGSREAIAKLTRAGHRLIVCTNQAGIARGIISTAVIEEIHRQLRQPQEGEEVPPRLRPLPLRADSRSIRTTPC